MSCPEESGSQSAEPTITGMALRLYLLSTQYRKPMEFEKERISEFVGILKRWYAVADETKSYVPQEFTDLLSDDLNTPGAIAVIHKYAKAKDGGAVHGMMSLLGFINEE